MRLIDSKQITMTSLEIADLVNSRHDVVKKSIERLVASGVISKPPLVDGEKSANGVITRVYQIGKRDSYIIVAQLSPEFTARLVDRWQELEDKQLQQFQIPQTLPEALRLAADLADQLEQAKPKLAVYDLLADRKGDVSTTIVAKELGTTAFKLNKFLRDNGIKWLNADLPKAGYETWFNCIADVKNGHEFTQCLISPKGQIEIAKLWSKA